MVNATLEGTDWILSGTLPGTTISLGFANGAVSGFAGCNTHNSTYLTTMTVDPSNTISVGPVNSTQQLRSEEKMNQEQAYLANVEAASQYTISGDVLTLTIAGGPLTFLAAVAALLTTQESCRSR